ncbi:hypothetical protein H6CHR_02121 [Variovorax sp. PBL-H6]|uniref:hypothetical protein n=1 Tax=Variovorax sp. PBL-H6 TaxID=434009 RepID=UPI001318FCD1|nr:hypothetical protein [Variovorax sp. PBL-H6]VTU24084.1 hypothetical protein H6CHR_02121 [Variovorax sp. PBL-H6]
MSLDFAILGQSGAPEKTLSLGVDLHYELITAAAARALGRFQDFEDYYEDAEIAADDLPELAEQVQLLRAEVTSIDLQRFLDGLSELVADAIADHKALHAIAD